MSRLKIKVTDAMTTRAVDAYMAEAVMWSWRVAGAYLYQLIRDESAYVGEYPPRHACKPPTMEPTYTAIPMVNVKSDEDAKKVFTSMRHRAAMTKALEAL